MDVHEDTGGRLRTLLDEAGAPALREDLLDEALARGGRLRRRRMVARGATGTLAAAAVVAGLVVGVPSLGGGAGRTVTPAAIGSAAASPSAAPVEAARALFPEEAELGGLRYHGAPWLGANQPAVYGPQICDPTVVGPAPDAERPLDVATINAVLPGVTDAGIEQADLTVSAWPDARGWQQLVADEGPCRWMGVDEAVWPGGNRTDRFLLVGREDPKWVVAVRRVGTSVVAVSIRRGGTKDSTAEAVRLVDLMTQRVAHSEWPGKDS